MAFFGLFQSTEDRELDSKLRFRQAKLRIQKFLQQCERNADQYYGLAKQAYKLGDDEQFRQLTGGYLQSQQTQKRWKQYLLKLNTLDMRRNEVAATSDFLSGMNELTGSILRGASTEDIRRMQLDLSKAIEKSSMQEEMLSLVMDATSTQLDGTDMLDDSALAQLTAGLDATANRNGQLKSQNQPVRRVPNGDRNQHHTDADFDLRIEQAMTELQTAGRNA
ncbi:MAG: hypothetical protein HQ518_10280 [Rhodopirellula sp.]|nr:hypothetical protein [Rhodopirellula sp.]